MKTAEQIIADNVYSPDDGIGEAGSKSIARSIIAELKSEGYIVVDASILAKSISSGITGGGAFIE